MTIQELLSKRFATKVFDASKKVSQEDLDYILECGRLSCSSFNIQPWQITVITNPELRSKLREASYGQPQVTDASHLLVVSVVKDPSVRIHRTVELITQKASAESAAKYKAMVEGAVPKDEKAKMAWLARQCYLALQTMILAAVDRGIDSCPMEGFSPEKYSELLDMKDATPLVLLPIGYAQEPGFSKIRIPKEDFISYLK